MLYRARLKSQTLSNTSMTTSDGEYYVTIDFQTENPDLNLPYSLIGLETAHPILRVDREIYIGTWATMVGTEMIFDEKGDWVTNVARRLVMTPVEIRKKNGEQARTAREMIIRAEIFENLPPDDNVQNRQDENLQSDDMLLAERSSENGSVQSTEQADGADIIMSETS